MIPLKYNVRNLRVRWKTTLMTMLGHGPGRLVVVHPLRPGRRPGAQPEHLGRPARPDRDAQGLDERDDRRLRDRPRPTSCSSCRASPATRPGNPLAAKELLNIPIAERENGTRTNIIVRGVQPASRKLRPDFRIVEGRDLIDGQGRVHRQPEHVAAVQGGPDRRQARFRRRRRNTRSSASSPPAAARPRARSGPTSRTS